MGINAQNTFEGRFGTTFGQPAQPSANRRDAQLWMNVGYIADVPTEEEGKTEQVFVSLPFGIPLDTQEPFDLSKIRNANMANLRSAQNDLLEQIMSVANGLAPGAEKIVALDKGTGLAVQIRRVNAPAEAAANEDNGLVRKLKLV